MADPVTQFKTREMLEAMRLVPRPVSFLRNMFVKRERTHGTKYLALDKIFGSQLIAAYSSAEGPGKTHGKRVRKQVVHTTPYVKEKVPYTPADFEDAPAGASPFDVEAANNEAEFVSDLLIDVEDRFVRREEQQVAEALQTGLVTVDGDEESFVVDFAAPSDHIFTLDDDLWTEGDSIDIEAQIAAWCKLPANKGAMTPNVMLMDDLAAACFLRNAGILKKLDLKNVQGYTLVQQYLGDDRRATYLGHLVGVGVSLDVYSYQGIYEKVVNGAISQIPYMNAYSVVLAHTAMNMQMHYGRINNFAAPGFRGTRFPYRYEELDHSKKYLAMESSPLVGHHQPESVVCATVGAVEE
jgi:hypothetical protein